MSNSGTLVYVATQLLSCHYQQATEKIKILQPTFKGTHKSLNQKLKSNHTQNEPQNL